MTRLNKLCLLYTSDAADEEDSVDLGGRRIIKKKNEYNTTHAHIIISQCQRSITSYGKPYTT